MIPDGDGQGGNLMVKRNNLNIGFSLDGNYLGSGSPRMSLSGAVRSAVFDLTVPFDPSVQLPVGAISAAEMFDEPGLTASRDTSLVEITSTSAATPTVLATQSINAPAAGYVLVSGALRLSMATNTSVVYGVTMGAAMPDVAFREDSFDDVVTTTIPVHEVFAVGPGLHTFRVVATRTSETIGAFVQDRQLTALFVPTAYGTVAAPAATSAAVVSRSEGAERRRAIAADRARVEAELAAMRERLDELHAELGAVEATVADHPR